VNIEFQRTVEDYREAVTARQKTLLGRKMTRALLWCAICIFGSALLVFLGVKQALAMMVIAACTLIPALTFYVIRPYWLVRDFRRHPNFARPVQMRIDDSGLHSQSEVWNETTKWAAYVKYTETENLFLLYLGARLVEIIPKRAFSGDQMEEFRCLVRTNL
jgi:uncharacterized membrane protein YdfJ with MMPL/SSD domain